MTDDELMESRGTYERIMKRAADLQLDMRQALHVCSYEVGYHCTQLMNLDSSGSTIQIEQASMLLDESVKRHRSLLLIYKAIEEAP